MTQNDLPGFATTQITAEGGTMKYIYTFIALVALATNARAVDLHNVTVRVDNEVYTCHTGTGGTTADPACVKETTDYCYSKTSLNSSDCFQKASTACKGAPSNFPQCVKESTDYCYSKTSMNATDCFIKSLEACGGSPDAIKSLMQQAAAQSQK